MTDLPESAPADMSAASAPIATAPADPAPAPAAPAVSSSTVVQSVVDTVTSHPAVPASAAPSIIASILGGLMQAEPAIFQVSRASSRTQAEVGLGLGLAEIILQAFVHPAA